MACPVALRYGLHAIARYAGLMSVYHIVSGTTRHLTDTAAFMAQLLPDFFAVGRDIIITRAPGRLDVMGGIADYSGALVLQQPMAQATHVALQLCAEPVLHIVSEYGQAEQSQLEFVLPLADFTDATGQPIAYEAAAARFRQTPAQHWAAYIAGAWLVLAHERGTHFAQGAKVLIRSAVPLGAGVSSSAALEVATLQAVAAGYGIALTSVEIAFLGQKVENLIAGAPCGVMDQMASACGVEGALLAILCQTGELRGTLKLPSDLALWGVASGVRHAVGGGDYGTVRTAAFMGYRILADVAGLPCTTTPDAGRVQITDGRWRGYLANVTPDEFFRDYAAHLPETLSGADFLARYQGITDTVTTVAPEKVYPVRAATRHPIEENARVQQFAALLRDWSGQERDAHTLGALMYASHASYTACGLGASATDLLVNLARDEKDLYGAKITGGGSGGTVAILGRHDAAPAVARIVAKYAQQSGYAPQVFTGSSCGAGVFGHLRVRRAA